MSTSLFDTPSPADTQPTPATNTFDYHPIPVSAPVALFLGVTSLFSFLTVGGFSIALMGLIFATVGLVIASWCLLKIIRSDGAMGGRTLAWSGLVLSACSLVGGPATHWYLYVNEVPKGFARLNFTDDISKKGFVIENGRAQPHPDVLALDGEKIFLKGYMYPSRVTQNFSAFVLCRDRGQCCFGGKPKLTDMIVVKMGEGETVDLISGLVSVAGTFHLRTSYNGMRFGSLTGAEPVYEIDAAMVEAAHTSF